MESKKTKKGLNQDRQKVAGGQDYEVNYEKEKLGVNAEALKDEIKNSGNSRKKIEKKLSGKGK